MEEKHFWLICVGLLLKVFYSEKFSEIGELLFERYFFRWQKSPPRIFLAKKKFLLWRCENFSSDWSVFPVNWIGGSAQKSGICGTFPKKFRRASAVVSVSRRFLTLSHSLSLSLFEHPILSLSLALILASLLDLHPIMIVLSHLALPVLSASSLFLPHAQTHALTHALARTHMLRKKHLRRL